MLLKNVELLLLPGWLLIYLANLENLLEKEPQIHLLADRFGANRAAKTQKLIHADYFSNGSTVSDIIAVKAQQQERLIVMDEEFLRIVAQCFIDVEENK